MEEHEKRRGHGGLVTARRTERRERLVSTDEVAEALSVHPKTVRRWILSGELPAMKLHRQWRIRTRDLDQLLTETRRVA